MIDKKYLQQILSDNGIETNDIIAEKFDCYAEVLLEWNEKMNLTAIKEPKEVAEKHFLDSLLALNAYGFPQGARLIDVGAGAGFPSVPIKLVRGDIDITLLDSLNKRITFLKELCKQLEISANPTHGRAEEYVRGKNIRESFDVATARAVANLSSLSEYCLPYVKVGGVLLALKGSEAENEAEQASEAIEILGGKIEEIKDYRLPDGSKRGIIIIKKISQTPTKYPRQFTKITKSPL